MVCDYDETTNLATVKVYLDGVEETALRQLEVSLSGAGTVPAVIAGLAPDTESYHTFRGLLDCIRILPQVLTTDEFLIAGGGSAPDFNGDGNVDGDDMLVFMDCALGPGISQTDPLCATADFDSDTDVDQADFAVFQRCISIGAVSWDPNCLD
jgi:hypothetical protein